MTLTRRSLMGLAAGVSLAPRALVAAPEATALQADADLLARIYRTLHPGLYRYQTPAQFDERCAALKAALRGRASLSDQYLALSRLLASIRCGHTYANFFNQTRAVAGELIAPRNKLPFHFLWLGPRLVVSGNPLAVDGLSRGDEILAINGVPVAQVQAALLPLVRADGSNDDKRRALLDVTGGDRIETFDVFYPLCFPTDGSAFRLVVHSAATGRTRTVAVDPVDQATRERMAPQTARDATPDYWRLAWPAPRVALVTMPGWAMYEVGWDWRARIAAIFEEIAHRGARGLIVDLRDNEGGNDCGNELVARLIDRELPLLGAGRRLVRFRSTPADLNPYLDTWDRSFEHLGEGAADVGDGFYQLTDDEDEVRRITPKGPRFRGRVVVLSGPQNSSATFQFIALMRRTRLARVYGQPTGGNQRGINGGSFFFVRLPNSGLEADLPLVGFFPDGSPPDAGLAPDLRIDPQPGDLASGRDRVLERAVRDLS